jgi:hypothetical protein
VDSPCPASTCHVPQGETASALVRENGRPTTDAHEGNRRCIGNAAAPQWVPGLALGVGGLLGVIAGARLQRRVPERVLRGLLALAALGAGLRMS